MLETFSVVSPTTLIQHAIKTAPVLHGFMIRYVPVKECNISQRVMLAVRI